MVLIGLTFKALVDVHADVAKYNLGYVKLETTVVASSYPPL